MIKSMRISGFKAAKKVELSDLGDVNLFIGPNGTGKSSLLSAAFLFCIEADAGKLISLAPPETDETDAEGIHRALSWLFTWNPTDLADATATGKKSIEVRGEVDGRARDVIVRTVAITPGLRKEAIGDLDRSAPSGSMPQAATRDLRAIRDSAELVLELTSTHDGESNAGRLFVSHAHGVFGESPRQAVRLAAMLRRVQIGGLDLAKMLDDSQAAGAAPHIEELLRTIDSGVRQLKIGVAANGSPVVRVDHERLGLCPLNVLGDGFSAALHFALISSIGKFKYVMLDEFDASLHVSVLRELAKFAMNLADEGVQLFLTTHRADTVGAFVDLVKSGWRGLRVFQTRLEDGEVNVQGFAGERLLSVWRDLALDIRVPS